MPDKVRIVAAIEAGGATEVIHMRTQHLGPDELLVAAKVQFPAHLGTVALTDAIDAAEARVQSLLSRSGLDLDLGAQDVVRFSPDDFAAHGYDAMWLTIQVMNIANPPETNEIRKAFHFGMNELMGVTGPILFDDYGDVKHYPKMFIVKNGQVTSYQRYLKTERERILGEVRDLLVTGGK